MPRSGCSSGGWTSGAGSWVMAWHAARSSRQRAKRFRNHLVQNNPAIDPVITTGYRPKVTFRIRIADATCVMLASTSAPKTRAGGVHWRFTFCQRWAVIPPRIAMTGSWTTTIVASSLYPQNQDFSWTSTQLNPRHPKITRRTPPTMMPPQLCSRE